MIKDLMRMGEDEAALAVDALRRQPVGEPEREEVVQMYAGIVHRAVATTRTTERWDDIHSVHVAYGDVTVIVDGSEHPTYLSMAAECHGSVCRDGERGWLIELYDETGWVRRMIEDVEI